MRSRFSSVIEVIVAVCGLVLEFLAFAGALPISIGFVGLCFSIGHLVRTFRNKK